LKIVIFETVDIKNFRSHESLVFEFTPNRFCIIAGPNGVGKTSIFDAMCWALYDTTTKGRKGDSIIRKRSGKNTSVILEFSIDEDIYLIKNYRKHHEFKDDKYLYKNSKDISGATRALTNEKIVNLLIPKDVFLNCIMFSQYITKSFTEMGDSGQKNIFDQMMGFGKYDEYQNNCKESIKDNDINISTIKEKLLLVEPSLIASKQSLKDEQCNIKNINELYARQYNDILAVVTNSNAKNKELKKKILNLDKLITEYEKILIDVTEIRSKIKDLSEQYKNKSDIITTKYTNLFNDKTSKINDKYKDKLTEIDKSLNSLTHDIEISQQKYNNYCDSLDTKFFESKELIDGPYNTKRTKINEDINKVLVESVKIDNLINNNDNKTKIKEEEIQNISKKLSEEIPKCYACNQSIKDESLEIIETDFKNKKRELQALINDRKLLTKNKLDNNKIRDKLSKEKLNNDNTHDEKINQLDEWKARNLTNFLNIWNEKKGEFKKSKIEINKNSAVVSQKLDSELLKVKIDIREKCNIELRELKTKNQLYLDNLKTKEEKLSNDIIDIKTKIDIGREFKNNINTNIATIKAKKEELENIKTNNKKYNMDYTDRVIRIEKVIEKQSEAKTLWVKNLNGLTRKEYILKFWKVGFSSKGIRGILLDDSIPILNEYANALSRETDGIRVRFDSQRPLKTGKLKNEFCVLPIQTRNLTDEREDFSAGEGRMVDIITLLSLRHLLEKTYDIQFNVSLFDEILDSLDIFNAEIVSGFLKTMSETSCTVLITHTLRNNIDADEMLEL